MRWRAQVQEHWSKTEQFKLLEYREYYALRWKLVADINYWPNDLKWVYELFKVRQKSSEDSKNPFSDYWSPRFFLVKDGELLYTSTGIHGWQSDIAPRLKELVGV